MFLFRPLRADRSMMPDVRLPTLADVLVARQTLSRYLPRTPLYRYPQLGELLGADVWIKHDNHLPTGAFKVRGGVNWMSQLSAEERQRGVITASTGNHAQSAAFAGQLFGVRVVVAMPNGANPVKVAATRQYGAEIRFVGNDFDDCRQYVEQTADSEGMKYLSSGDERLLIAGVATQTWEILETLPDVDAILVPVGGGSGAAGACLAAKQLRPDIRVIGVQAEGAPSAWRTWKERRPVEAPIQTFAEGLSTRTPFALPQQILKRDLDDFLLVSDDDLRTAMRWMLEHTRNLVEGAGAAALAGAWQIRTRLQGQRIALVQSGGNIAISALKDLLTT